MNTPLQNPQHSLANICENTCSPIYAIPPFVLNNNCPKYSCHPIGSHVHSINDTKKNKKIGSTPVEVYPRKKLKITFHISHLSKSNLSNHQSLDHQSLDHQYVIHQYDQHVILLSHGFIPLLPSLWTRT